MSMIRISLHSIQFESIGLHLASELNGGISLHSIYYTAIRIRQKRKNSLINCVRNENRRNSPSCLLSLPIWSNFQFDFLIYHTLLLSPTRSHTIHEHVHGHTQHAYQLCNSIFVDVTSNGWICEWCVFTGFHVAFVDTYWDPFRLGITLSITCFEACTRLFLFASIRIKLNFPKRVLLNTANEHVYRIFLCKQFEQ